MFPTLINIGHFKLYSYPLLMGLAWGVAYQMSLNNLQKNKINTHGFRLLFWGVFFSSWLGAKLLFLLVSAGNSQAIYSTSSNFWLGGGFVFYGGFILGLGYLLFYTFVLKKFSFNQCYLFLPGLVFSKWLKLT